MSHTGGSQRFGQNRALRRVRIELADLVDRRGGIAEPTAGQGGSRSGRAVLDAAPACALLEQREALRRDDETDL
jgi:hypothetical protein